MMQTATSTEPHWARRVAASPWAPAIIILVGLALRIAYIAIAKPEFYLAEASAAAIAVAEGRGLADAYFPGSGPTAHLLPTTPVVAGMIMKAFGIRTAMSQIALVAFALMQTVVVSVLLMKLFSKLDVPKFYVLCGLAASLFLPTMFPQDAYIFSCWDNGLAFIACLFCLVDLVSVWSAATADGLGHRLRSAAILAVAVFFNPVFGLALAACTFLVRLIRSSFRSAVSTGILSLAVFAMIVAPWAWRNQQVLGSPIFLRSNAGLELAMANHDAALSSQPSDQVFYARNMEIHPFSDGPGRAELRRVGEPAYQNELGRKTREWIMDHPAGFLELAARHMFRTLTPEAWQVGNTAARPRALVIALVCWAGVLALLWLLVRRRSQPWWIVALFLVVAIVAYSPFQPMVRYIYPFYELFLFTIFAGIGAWQGRARVGEPDMSPSVSAASPSGISR